MNLLITGAWTDAAFCFDRIRAMGHRILFMQDERGPLPDGGLQAEGVICNGLFLYHDICDFRDLAFIQLTSAGFDRVPAEYIRRHGIRIHNARGVYSIPMAEYALTGVLNLYRQTSFFYENQRKHRWEKHRGLTELYGKQVCILGCGSVGTECAKRFSAFGCRVTGVDICPGSDPHFSQIFPIDRLDDFLGEMDIIVLCLPLNASTKHLMNLDRLRRLKDTAVLVNISRGSVLDTYALCQVLPQIRGAVLDVFEEEPLDEAHPLWECENVILTPHNSFVGDGNHARLRELILRNLGSFHT